MFNKSGSSIINSSIANFTKVVKELETGIARCAKEEETANAEITKLNNALVEIQNSKSRASTIKDNIEKMLGL